MELSLEWYFIANFSITVAILTVSVRRVGFSKPLNLFMGALIAAMGTVMSTAGLFPRFHYELVLLPVSVLIALGRRRLSDLLRGMAWCIMWTCLSAGVIMFLGTWFRVNPLWTMLLLSLPLFALGLFSPDVGSARASGEVRVRISTRMGTAEVNAMIDTGNRLHEPFSGLPVIVVSSKCLVDILDPICLDEDSLLPPGFRVVRYRVLGGGGYMRCFRPETMSCLRGNRWVPVPDMWIAIYSGSIPGALDALAPPSVQSGY